MKIRPYVFRKILHMIACAIVVTILMSLQSWTDVLIAAAVAIVIIYPLLYHFEKYPAYQRFFVEKGRGEIRMSLVLLFGMLMVMTAIGWGIFDDRHAVLGSLLMWGFGDATAALVGIPYGKHRIGKKSLEGSIAMFVVAFALGFGAVKIFTDLDLMRSLVLCLVSALVCTLSELFTPSRYDTFSVPILTLLAILIMKAIL